MRVRHVCFNETVTVIEMPLLDEHVPPAHVWMPASSPQSHAKAGGERGFWLMNESARRAASDTAQREANDVEGRLERVLRLIVQEGTCLFTAMRLDTLVRATPGTTMGRACEAREMLAEMEAAKLAAMIPVKKRLRDPEVDGSSCGERPAVAPCVSLSLPAAFLPQSNAAMALRAIG